MSALGSALGSALVAVVDDDLSVRQALATLLRASGFRTAEFGSAEAFLAHGTPSIFDCLITDIQMPGLSGIDLKAHLDATGHVLPVIMITAMTGNDLLARAARSRPAALLGKPFDADALLEQIARVLKQAPPYTNV